MQATPRQRRTTTDARVLDATATLLTTGHRYADLPVERILAAAGVSRSTFYQRFRDKTGLVQRLAQPGIEEFIAASNAWWQREIHGSSDVLADIVKEMFQLARTYRPIWLAFLETAETDREFGAEFRRATDAYAATMASRIDRERREGLVPADVDPAQTARFIVATTRAGIVEILTSEGPADDDAFARTLGRAFWCAMYAQADSGTSTPRSHRRSEVGAEGFEPPTAGV